MRQRLAHWYWGLGVSLVLLLLAVPVGWLAGGAVAAAGVAAGIGTVAASYSVSSVAIAWADSVAPAMVLPVGLTVYGTKIGVIGVVMASVAASGWPGLTGLGVGVCLGVVGWTGAQIWWVTRINGAGHVASGHG